MRKGRGAIGLQTVSGLEFGYWHLGFLARSEFGNFLGTWNLAPGVGPPAATAHQAGSRPEGQR